MILQLQPVRNGQSQTGMVANCHVKLELLRFEQEVKAQTIENRLKEQACITELVNNYQKVSSFPGSVIDEHAQKLFKNAYISMLPNYQPEQGENNQEMDLFVPAPPSFPKKEESFTPEISNQKHNQGTVVDVEESGPLQSLIDGMYNPDQKTVDQDKTTTTITTFTTKTKSDRKSAFTLKNLLDEMDIEVDRAFMPAIGKSISAKFKKINPKGETFTRKKIAYFYEEDRDCLKNLIHEEYSHYDLLKSEMGVDALGRTAVMQRRHRHV